MAVALARLHSSAHPLHLSLPPHASASRSNDTAKPSRRPSFSSTSLPPTTACPLPRAALASAAGLLLALPLPSQVDATFSTPLNVTTVALAADLSVPLSSESAVALTSSASTEKVRSAVSSLVSAAEDLERAAADVFGRAVSAEGQVQEQVGQVIGSGAQVLEADSASFVQFVGSAADAAAEAVEWLRTSLPATSEFTEGIASFSLPTNGAIFDSVSAGSALITVPVSSAWSSLQLTSTSTDMQTAAFYASFGVLLLALANQPRE